MYYMVIHINIFVLYYIDSNIMRNSISVSDYHLGNIRISFFLKKPKNTKVKNRFILVKTTIILKLLFNLFKTNITLKKLLK